jgi:hypothetical protein
VGVSGDNAVTSRGLLIFTDQAAEAVTAGNPGRPRDPKNPAHGLTWFVLDARVHQVDCAASAEPNDLRSVVLRSPPVSSRS